MWGRSSWYRIAIFFFFFGREWFVGIFLTCI